jgi:hypothetical protein
MDPVLSYDFNERTLREATEGHSHRIAATAQSL